MSNTNIGHKAKKSSRHFCTYSVYDNRTDFPVVIGGTAAECARAMKVTLASFYCCVNRARTGKVNRWTIIKEYEDGKPDFDHREERRAEDGK